VGKINREDYPSNSRTTKDKDVKQVVQASVRKKKPGLCKRILGNFFADNLSSVSSYVVYDVVIPEAKRMLQEIITGGTDIILFGEKTPSSRSRKRSSGSHVRYNSLYDEKRVKTKSSRSERSEKPWHSYDDIIFNHRSHAVDALQAMIDIIDEYNEISVANFYEIVGVKGSHTDRNYGWEDLSSAKIEHIRGEGYRINLPKAKVI